MSTNPAVLAHVRSAQIVLREVLRMYDEHRWRFRSMVESDLRMFAKQEAQLKESTRQEGGEAA